MTISLSMLIQCTVVSIDDGGYFKNLIYNPGTHLHTDFEQTSWLITLVEGLKCWVVFPPDVEYSEMIECDSKCSKVELEWIC